jgi:diaminopimelate decarboxylase
VAIRVNPDFELKYSGLRMGGGARPFGVDAEQVPELLRRLSTMPLEFLGFHIYCGGQTLDVDSLIEAQQRTFELAQRLAREAPAPVKWLNIGGGFGLPYFPGEQPLDLAPLGAALAPLLQQAQRHMPGVQPVLELGRYLVGSAGVYLCRVLDRKISRGRVFLVTNGGLHHHLAATGNFGQVLRKNYPVTIANRLASESAEQVSIVGPLCTPLDLLADNMVLPRAEIGDIVAVFQSGAYGFSASPQRFLSHPPPTELCLGPVNAKGTRPASQ